MTALTPRISKTRTAKAGLGETRPAFQIEAAEVLGEVRASVGELLASLPGVRRPADLKQALSVDYRLSWRLFRVAEATDPLEMGPHVPGPAAMARVLERAAARGVPERVVEAARRAAGEFDRLVNKHATTRASFDAMVAAVAGEGASRVEWEHKRAMFRAAARLHGIQVQTHVKATVLSHASEPGCIDFAYLRGHCAMRRLRPHAPLLLSNSGFNATDYEAMREKTVREPLDPDGMSEHGVSLLTRFSSRPLPEIHTSDLSKGRVQTDLVGAEIGLDSEVTCILGDVVRNVMSPQGTEDPWVCVNAIVRTPMEVLVHDVLVADDLFGPVEPRLLVFTEGSMLDLARGHEQTGLLPIQETVTRLGRGIGVMHTPDVPGYGDMLRFAFGRLGWEAERFTVYRCRVEYPVMHSVVSMRFDLPDEAA